MLRFARNDSAGSLQIELQPWMTEPATRRLRAALEKAGIAMRFVGGCVRDALLGLPIGDIDIATPARPEEVTAALAKAKIKTVPTGIAHGTVTAVVPPRHFEITTLRRDVETYGRHAKVAFDADWAVDAGRRDFTINAIYLDPDGTIHDPVGGVADLQARRVRFVGDPRQRIAEDVLRLLRYYRFEARFGTGTGDAEARAACGEAAPLLPNLSAERVAAELLRLLSVADPVPALRMMRDDGVLAVILPEATRLERLSGLVALEAPSHRRSRGGLPPPQAGEGWGLQPDALVRLAALIEVGAAGAVALAERLRLSNAQRERLAGLAPPWPINPGSDDRAQRRALYELGREHYRDLVILLAADGRVDGARMNQLRDLAANWTPPEFPLTGRDVTALGIPPGLRVGRLLDEVRGWWEAGDFAAGREACLNRLSEVAGRS